jgi:hypothetical protein
MNHSTEFLNAPSLAALTVGLFYVRIYRIGSGRPNEIHQDAPDHLEQQTRGGHRQSERGDILEQSLQTSHPPFWQMTVGTGRQTRSY